MRSLLNEKKHNFDGTRNSISDVLDYMKENDIEECSSIERIGDLIILTE